MNITPTTADVFKSLYRPDYLDITEEKQSSSTRETINYLEQRAMSAINPQDLFLDMGDLKDKYDHKRISAPKADTELYVDVTNFDYISINEVGTHKRVMLIKKNKHAHGGVLWSYINPQGETVLKVQDIGYGKLEITKQDESTTRTNKPEQEPSALKINLTNKTKAQKSNTHKAQTTGDEYTYTKTPSTNHSLLASYYLNPNYSTEADLAILMSNLLNA